MTPTRRIFLNIIATYGRSLYALVVGLICGRWTLMALGENDYGLLGLVGGMASSVSFLNTLLASSVSRFYAVSVGAAKQKGNETSGLEECRKWFNIALSIHTIVPLFLIVFGYPVGVYVIEHFLVIANNRIDACIWVWRFVCVSCFISMLNVPFNAMYNAKQEIAELTVYSFISTTANALFLFYMVNHPGVWLTKYAAWTCILSVIPQFFIIWRALIKYSECRFVYSYLYDKTRIKELLKFVTAKFWSEFSSMFSDQGQALLVNKYMGPAYNASKAIGTNVAYHTMTLAGAITGSFAPAIANLFGEGKLDDMKRFCYMSCRIGSIMVLVFALPVMIEIRELLRLWLVNPPNYSAEICIIILLRGVLEQMSNAYSTAIYSKGYKVVKYSWTVGWAGFSTVIVSWVFFFFDFGMLSLVIGLAFSKIFTVVVRLIYGKEIIDFEAGYWIKRIFLPIMFFSVISFLFGYGVRFIMAPSLSRVIMSSLICEMVFLPAIWLGVLNCRERTFITSRLKKSLQFIHKSSKVQ